MWDFIYVFFLLKWTVFFRCDHMCMCAYCACRDVLSHDVTLYESHNHIGKTDFPVTAWEFQSSFLNSFFLSNNCIIKLSMTPLTKEKKEKNPCTLSWSWAMRLMGDLQIYTRAWFKCCDLTLEHSSDLPTYACESSASWTSALLFICICRSPLLASGPGRCFSPTASPGACGRLIATNVIVIIYTPTVHKQNTLTFVLRFKRWCEECLRAQVLFSIYARLSLS